MIKLYTGCLVLFIGNLIVGQSSDNIKIVKYDINTAVFKRSVRGSQMLHLGNVHSLVSHKVNCTAQMLEINQQMLQLGNVHRVWYVTKLTALHKYCR